MPNRFKLLLILWSFPCLMLAQLREVQSVITESYTHNASTYVTHGPPLYNFPLKNGDFLIVNQNDNLQRRNADGTVVWQKKFDKTRRQKRAALDSDENLVISFYNYIKKYNANGAILWEFDVEPLFNREHMMTNMVAIDEENNIYLVGQISYSEYLFLMKLDPQGTVLWHKLHRQNGCRDRVTFAPKDHVFMGENLYFLNNASRCATLYKLNSHGSITNTQQFDQNYTSIRTQNDTLIAVNYESWPNELRVHRFDKNLITISNTATSLPYNTIFKKPIYEVDSLDQVVKVRYQEVPSTYYQVNDFLVEKNGAVTIAGVCAKGPWICQISTEGTINWNWWHSYEELYEVPRDQRKGTYQHFETIERTSQGYSVLGIHNERRSVGRTGSRITLFKKQFVFD